MNALRHGEQEMLDNLSRLFHISTAAVGPYKRPALAVLGMLFTLPSAPDHATLHQNGKVILRAAHEAVPPAGRRHASHFQQQVGGQVAMMQVAPGWFGNFRHDPELLVRKYEMCRQIVFVLNLLGLQNAGGAANSAVGKFIETGSLKATAKVGASRLIGMSDTTDALRKKLGGLPGRTMAANAVSAALLALATATYASAKANLRQIELIVEHKFKSGQLSEADYQAVFESSDPHGIERYWEY